MLQKLKKFVNNALGRPTEDAESKSKLYSIALALTVTLTDQIGRCESVDRLPLTMQFAASSLSRATHQFIESAITDNDNAVKKREAGYRIFSNPMNYNRRFVEIGELCTRRYFVELYIASLLDEVSRMADMHFTSSGKASDGEWGKMLNDDIANGMMEELFGKVFLYMFLEKHLKEEKLVPKIYYALRDYNWHISGPTHTHYSDDSYDKRQYETRHGPYIPVEYAKKNPLYDRLDPDDYASSINGPQRSPTSSLVALAKFWTKCGVVDMFGIPDGADVPRAATHLGDDLDFTEMYSKIGDITNICNVYGKLDSLAVSAMHPGHGAVQPYNPDALEMIIHEVLSLVRETNVDNVDMPQDSECGVCLDSSEILHRHMSYDRKSALLTHPTCNSVCESSKLSCMRCRLNWHHQCPFCRGPTSRMVPVAKIARTSADPDPQMLNYTKHPVIPRILIFLGVPESSNYTSFKFLIQQLLNRISPGSDGSRAVATCGRGIIDTARWGFSQERRMPGVHMRVPVFLREPNYCEFATILLYIIGILGRLETRVPGRGEGGGKNIRLTRKCRGRGRLPKNHRMSAKNNCKKVKKTYKQK